MQKFSTDWQEHYLGGSPNTEASLVKKWAKQIQEIQFWLRNKKKDSVIRRAFHAKMLAGVSNAKFRIRDDIPIPLQVGFFVPGREYNADVRFSSANGSIQEDTKGDFRGIAIRIKTGEESVTDYLLTNGEVSHARNARQFMIVARAAAGSRLLAFPRLLFGLGPFELIRVARVLMNGTKRKVNSLATEQYWSRGPYKWGDFAVRFTIRPSADTSEVSSEHRSSDYLRNDLIQRLNDGPIIFDFEIQPFTGETTPIEDNAKPWDSEFIKVAELILPQQNLTLAENRARELVIDEMEFNPWHTTNEFRPLSSLNRARKQVYHASAHYRSGRQTIFKRGPIGALVVFLLKVIWRPLNRIGLYWHNFSPLIGVTNLDLLREDLREKNLYDKEIREKVPKPSPTISTVPVDALGARTPEGKYNDLSDPLMGAQYTRFGRNMPCDKSRPDNILDPNPREVSLKLLQRKEFIPASTLNVLAAAWINFMVHGWFDHIRENHLEGKNIKVPLPNGDDAWHEDPMQLHQTQCDLPPDEILRNKNEILKDEDDYTNLDILQYKNRISHWWDGSQLYGNTPERIMLLRTGPNSDTPVPDGKLAIGDDGLLPLDPEVKFDIDLTGFNNNWWIGLSLLHTIFAMEHNAIADRLKTEYPKWNGDQLFEKARLINAALIAKIHTVEWTPAIIAHPTLRISMDTNWWGAVGKDLHELLPRQSDSEAMDGILGSPTDHHAAPFSLTEEFATVYRLHPLIPDDYIFHSHTDNSVRTVKKFDDIQGKGVRDLCNELPLSDLFYSLGIANPGAVTLHNYPRALMDFTSRNEGRKDLATADVIRERERGVPRYNDFRKYLRMPRINSFEEMSSNPESSRLLKEIYGHVDNVDTLVGMLSETPPKGFGFSDTAFRIFILMASRRLKSDRFFTADWRPEVYTETGLNWVRDNDMRTIILRHFPELEPALQRTSNTFAPWNRVGQQGTLKSRIITDPTNMSNRPLRLYNRLARIVSYFGRRTS